jgi:hypothetical protein
LKIEVGVKDSLFNSQMSAKIKIRISITTEVIQARAITRIGASARTRHSAITAVSATIPSLRALSWIAKAAAILAIQVMTTSIKGLTAKRTLSSFFQKRAIDLDFPVVREKSTGLNLIIVFIALKFKGYLFFQIVE